MILGDRDVQFIVAELQSKFASAHEIFVLPPSGVGVGAHPGEPLGQFVQARPIIQNFVPTARSDGIWRDSVGPFHFKLKCLTTDQWFREINAHH